MFSPDIVDSDAFLDMPSSSQLLYFHLAMRADDDGFVSPKKIMRLVGASSDDLKVLVAKRFVLPFETGVVVIKHWLIHNLIRKDRYKKTRYLDERKLLVIKENGAYTELATSGLQSGNQLAPQVRLGKVRLGKVRKEKNTDTITSDGQAVAEVFRVFESINPSIKRMYGNTTQRASANNLIKQFGLENVLKAAHAAVSIQGVKFAPRIATPYQLETKWAELVGHFKEKKSSENKVML
mgnify:CR=1 FL=1